MDLLNLIVGVVIPILAGLIFRSTAPSAVKRIIVLALAVLATVLRQVIDGAGVLTEQMVLDGVEMFIVAVASYFGVFKDTKLANLAPSRGIGGVEVDPDTGNVLRAP